MPLRRGLARQRFARGPRARSSITGIVGAARAEACARRLHRERRVIGIDRRPFATGPRTSSTTRSTSGARRRATSSAARQSPRSCTSASCTTRAQRRPSTTPGTSPAFRSCSSTSRSTTCPKLVVLSSANVYGPRPDNPQFLTEDAPLLGGARFSEIRDLVEVDMLAQSFFWKHPETETVILRPVHILGTVQQRAVQLPAPPRHSDAPRASIRWCR